MKVPSLQTTSWRDLRETILSWRNVGKKKFECPLCSFYGPFADVNPRSGKRQHARCPRCGSLERHRLQYLVIAQILAEQNNRQRRILHFAPEPFLRSIFEKSFDDYETADIEMPGVDHYVDLQGLPFPNGSYDLVYASHVLEHVKDDSKAISEIRRIMRPGGIAILPVPVVCEKTVEYPNPNPNEQMHVRAPGLDYFDRLAVSFGNVALFRSDAFPEKFQLFIHEDRTVFPNDKCPFRPGMKGSRHADIVPVCRV